MYQDFYEYVNACLLEDKIPHAFLIESSNLETTTENLITYLYSKNLIKNQDYQNNLNFMLVEPDGTNIKSEAVNYLHNFFATKPVDNKYNIFLIKYANKLNASAANKILKFLEEPSDNIIGFLLIESESIVLPTIKSRCQIFKVIEQDENTIDEQTEVFFELLQNIDIKQQLLLKHTYSRVERSDLIIIIQKTMEKYDSFLSQTKGFENVENYSTNILILNNILHMLKSNVNIELVLDKLCIELRK